ncbi:MAG: transcription termination factor NusA [Fimbriimonadaceae bacterium]|nr:transcription termination factor NusA [Fimbriimonadaceae bacterium]
MDILQQLKVIASERDLPVEELQKDLEEALAAAYKQFIGTREGEIKVRITLNPLTATVGKEVVAVVTDPQRQISLEDAIKRDKEMQIGDLVYIAVDPNQFGRIAAQTTKQVLQQKLRDSERNRIQTVFNERLGEITSGSVVRREPDRIVIDVNNAEAEMPRREQVPTEPYRINDRIQVLVLKVDDQQRGRIRVTVSRTHPNLLRKLFEKEVPEIKSGIVVIKSVAREPGQRSKIAVMTTDERVDPIGACIGPRGARVQAIVDELYDEKIDVVPFSEDPRKYITDALSPAKVNSIKINDVEKSALVIVPDSQLSLAIGKGGQNVRLAARLTEWKIDIRSESQASGAKR